MAENADDGAVGMLTAGESAGFQEAPVRPRIGVGAARALYVGPGLDLAPHCNAAATIAVALGAPFELRVWRSGRAWSTWQTDFAEVIAPGTLHHLKSHGPMAFLYLDPMTDRHCRPDPQALQRGVGALRALGPAAGIDEAFAAFGLARRLPQDARITRVVHAVERSPAAFGRLQDAAALACLSPSRFRARFDAEVGIPFRRYRLWRRMAVVMRTIAAGGNLTEAAFAAGFSSSAHLSSTFKRMFGLTASGLLALGVEIDLSQDEALPRQDFLTSARKSAGP
jgi:AraC-like DNA-binding protein